MPRPRVLVLVPILLAGFGVAHASGSVRLAASEAWVAQRTSPTRGALAGHRSARLER
jgi:hypothetical protein